MSFQKSVKVAATRLGKPFRKRRKLGREEDAWCDALNELSVDSSSSGSDEYHDALEDEEQQQKPLTRIRAAIKRKISSSKKSNERRRCDSDMSKYMSRERSAQEKRRGFQYKPTDYSDSSIHHVDITNTYQFGVGSDRGSSSSSDVDSYRSTSSSGPSQQKQTLVESPTDTGAVSDRQLEKLAKALTSGEYQNARSLGIELGFNRTTTYNYCGYGKPSESGTLGMLRAWRKKTSGSKQRTDLLDALNKANLNHLANTLYLHEVKQLFSPRRPKITVTLMTSSQLFTIEGLKKKIHELKHFRSDLIEEVRVLQLPYSRIQYYEFMEPVDVMILCHSIENRRFAITNVTDSLYDAFLDYCNKKLGKERIVVIAHDFPPEEEKVRKTKMDTFKHTQWSTFENAGLVMICGMMDKEPEIKEQDWDSLVKFLEAASRSDPDKADTSPTPPGKKHTQPSTPKASKPETTNKKNDKAFRISLPGHGKVATRSRRPVIYVCTSWGLHTVKGLKGDLQTLLKRSFSEYDIREQELPYSRLKDFRFPSEADKMDAMILCHSVQNRGFSVTDVPNSIYDDYLTYCNRLFGKNHVAVIVHDFEYRPEILKVHIDTFRRGQPTTFELAKFIALAGKLDVPDVHLVHDDSQSLETFVKGLR